MLPAYSCLTDAAWNEKIDAADGLAASCRLCPRLCDVNRHQGEHGFCRSGNTMVISSIFPHHGEEPCLSGTHGSGTVFFSGCTLCCVFCQNHQISHDGVGTEYTPRTLADRLLWLAAQGCHNINLVTATHFLPWMLRGLRMAAADGCTLPVVYNCGGYELPHTIALLRDVVDIWLPDSKYGDPTAALTFSQAPDYVSVNHAAIREMFRQSGPLRLDAEGIATRGICIRHLVLPGGLAASEQICRFLATTFDPADLTVSVMAQYRPLHHAVRYPQINRRVSLSEYDAVVKMFKEAGFEGYYQEADALDEAFVIDFKNRTHEPLDGK